jgi:L-lactate dehydrogenase complex protein LldE
LSESEVVKPPIRVGLFVTCLVDLMRPSVGFAAVKLLEDAGCQVIVPSQSCCGQPAYNSGDRATTQAIARQVIAAFADCDYVVAPSGSCAGMLAKHYPELFADEPEMAIKAAAFAAKCGELVSFLVDRLGVTRVAARYSGVATYHDSCSGLRELGVRDQPRKLLASVEGLRLVELEESDVCCGFGGTFAVKYSDLSDAIVTRKSAKIDASGADTLIAGDLGCLMNMVGKLQREGRIVKARHVAEVLAGMTDEPAIGEPASDAAAKGAIS